MPILGGLYTVTGPIVGALVLTLLGEYLRTAFGAANLFAYGLTMVFVILWVPDGLVGFARRRCRRTGTADVSIASATPPGAFVPHPRSKEEDA